MKTSENNDHFLSDWLAGKMSDDQLKELVSESDYAAFQKLRQSFEGLQIPEPDMERNYSAIQTKLSSKASRKPGNIISLYEFLSAAAAILLLFGLYEFFIFSNEKQTDFGQTAVLNLSDNSTITMNAKSKISYPTLFKYNRSLELEGEAFFEVKKGTTFKVDTKHGDICVLGTKFNVVSANEYFEVICFEGKVEVTMASGSLILTQGEAVRLYNNKTEQWTELQATKPLWISGESRFKNTPLEHVIRQVERQYHYDIDYPESLRHVRYTGGFTHKNLETALKSVCIPINLKYSKTKAGKITISE